MWRWRLFDAPHSEVSAATTLQAGGSPRLPLSSMVLIEDETLRLDTVCQPLQVRDPSRRPFRNFVEYKKSISLALKSQRVLTSLDSTAR